MFLPCRDLAPFFYLRRKYFYLGVCFHSSEFFSVQMFFQWDSVCYKLLALALASPHPSWYPKLPYVSSFFLNCSYEGKFKSVLPNVTFSVVFKMQDWSSSYNHSVHCCWRHGNRRFPIFSCDWFYKPLLTLAIAYKMFGADIHQLLESVINAEVVFEQHEMR